MSLSKAALIDEVSGQARPSVWSRYTTDQLWQDPHIAQQMLRAHLDPNSDRASRRPEKIEATADWLDREIGLSGKALCDLGCGPGLYARRFSERRAQVTGVDFSHQSVAYAKSHVPDAAFQTADYLADPLPMKQDIVTLICCDYGALSPDRRQMLLQRIFAALRPGGWLYLDVMSQAAFSGFQEDIVCEPNLMGGFWSDAPYLGLLRQCRYDEDRVSLEQFIIVEDDRRREIFNWNQYFDATMLAGELTAAGFGPVEMPGGPFDDPDLIWALAQKG